MRISYKRKADDAYLFQHIDTRELVWLQKHKAGFVLLSLNEKDYVPGLTALGTELIAGMLAHGQFPEQVQDVEIVETEAIGFQTLDPQSSHKRDP